MLREAQEAVVCEVMHEAVVLHEAQAVREEAVPPEAAVLRGAKDADVSEALRGTVVLHEAQVVSPEAVVRYEAQAVRKVAVSREAHETVFREVAVAVLSEVQEALFAASWPCSAKS